jgi:hypothetical protein
MATNTDRFKLSKPSLSDNIDITVLNDNCDKLDAGIGFQATANNTLAKGVPASAVSGTNNLVYNENVVSGNNNVVRGSSSIVAGNNNIFNGTNSFITSAFENNNINGDSVGVVTEDPTASSSSWFDVDAPIGNTNHINVKNSTIENGGKIHLFENNFTDHDDLIAGFEDSHLEGKDPRFIVFPSMGYNPVISPSTSTIGLHLEGYQPVVACGGQGVHAEGYKTTAFGLNGSGFGIHVEGKETKANAAGAHAEGSQTYASGEASHAEGIYTKAFGVASHAEGEGAGAVFNSVLASGRGSHAEGYGTSAIGAYSHAGGYHTQASEANQTVIGKYNSTSNTAAFIIGNGTSTQYANAFEVDWNGNVNIKGSYKQNGVAIETLPSVTSSDNGKILTVDSGAWTTGSIPTELPAVTSADDGRFLGVVNGAWGTASVPTELPSVTTADNGDVLTVINGAWGSTSAPSGTLPAVTSADNGKVLGVVNGAWTPTTASGGGGASENYSYTEQVIGTWVDGKPIYRKTFYMGVFSQYNGALYAYTTDLNIDNVIKISAMMYEPSGNFWSPIHYIEPYDSFDQSISTFVYINNEVSSINVRKSDGSRHNGSQVYATVEYTKTTDSRVVTANLFNEKWLQCHAEESADSGRTWAQVGHYYSSTNKATSEELITCTGNYLSWDDTVYKIGIFYFDANDLYTGVYEWLTSPQAFQNYPRAGLSIQKLTGADNSAADFSANAHVMLNSGSSALPYIHY